MKKKSSGRRLVLTGTVHLGSGSGLNFGQWKRSRAAEDDSLSHLFKSAHWKHVSSGAGFTVWSLFVKPELVLRCWSLNNFMYDLSCRKGLMLSSSRSWTKTYSTSKEVKDFSSPSSLSLTQSHPPFSHRRGPQKCCPVHVSQPVLETVTHQPCVLHKQSTKSRAQSYWR